ncbi:prolipoprotein diacylglyceryl transferase [Paraglaciecola sp. Hal342]
MRFHFTHYFAFSLIIGLIVVAILGKKQSISVGDSLVSIVIYSLVVGRLVFVIKFYDSYDSLWQILDIRDRGFDTFSSFLAGAIYTAVSFASLSVAAKNTVNGHSDNHLIIYQYTNGD